MWVNTTKKRDRECKMPSNIEKQTEDMEVKGLGLVLWLELGLWLRIGLRLGLVFPKIFQKIIEIKDFPKPAPSLT